MDNTDVLWPIQTALYDRLTGDPVLAGKITGVFDEVPENQPFDYIVIGEATETPQGAHDRFGARATITLHIWSVYAGHRDALAIRADVMRLLDHQPLDLDGHDLIALRHQQTATLRDPDIDVRHIVVRFAIETENQDAA